MRILMICPELPTADRPGGMAPAVRQFDSLRCRGHNVQVIDMSGRRVVKYAEVLPKIWKQMRICDLVHAHYGFCGWLGRTGVNKPLVVSFMGSDINGDNAANGRPRFATRIESLSNRILLSRLASHVIVKSNAMADVLGGKLKASGRLSVIPNGVDIDRFQPQDRTQAREILGWNPNRNYILFPSDPNRANKGYELASAAVKLVARELDRPVDLIPLWGVAPEEVPVYMNACNVMTLASFAEGSPNVVKEALACGLPTVSTAVGDVPEMLAGIRTCYISTRDPADMAHGILRVIAMEGRETSRKRILESGLTLDAVAGRIEAIYQKIVQRN